MNFTTEKKIQEDLQVSSPERQIWANMQRLIMKIQPPLRPPMPRNSFRRLCYRLVVANPLLQSLPKKTDRLRQRALTAHASHNQVAQPNRPKNSWTFLYNASVETQKTRKTRTVRAPDIFEWFIAMCIVLNTVILSLEHWVPQYQGMPPGWAPILDSLNIVFSAIFACEAVIKLAALAPRHSAMRHSRHHHPPFTSAKHTAPTITAPITPQHPCNHPSDQHAHSSTTRPGTTL